MPSHRMEDRRTFLIKAGMIAAAVAIANPFGKILGQTTGNTLYILKDSTAPRPQETFDVDVSLSCDGERKGFDLIIVFNKGEVDDAEFSIDSLVPDMDYSCKFIKGDTTDYIILYAASIQPLPTGQVIQKENWPQGDGKLVTMRLKTEKNPLEVRANGIAVDMNYRDTNIDYKFLSELISDIIKRPDIKTDYSLSQNYPNPFNDKTTVEFNTPKQVDANFEVYNVKGERVYGNNFTAVQGKNTITFDKNLPSGPYFYRIKTPDYTEVRKMVILK